MNGKIIKLQCQGKIPQKVAEAKAKTSPKEKNKISRWQTDPRVAGIILTSWFATPLYNLLSISLGRIYDLFLTNKI